MLLADTFYCKESTPSMSLTWTNSKRSPIPSVFRFLQVVWSMWALKYWLMCSVILKIVNERLNDTFGLTIAPIPTKVKALTKQQMAEIKQSQMSQSASQSVAQLLNADTSTESATQTQGNDSESTFFMSSYYSSPKQDPECLECCWICFNQHITDKISKFQSIWFLWGLWFRNISLMMNMRRACWLLHWSLCFWVLTAESSLVFNWFYCFCYFCES